MESGSRPWLTPTLSVPNLKSADGLEVELSCWAVLLNGIRDRHRSLIVTNRDETQVKVLKLEKKIQKVRDYAASQRWFDPGRVHQYDKSFLEGSLKNMDGFVST